MEDFGIHGTGGSRLVAEREVFPELSLSSGLPGAKARDTAESGDENFEKAQGQARSRQVDDPFQMACGMGMGVKYRF